MHDNYAIATHSQLLVARLDERGELVSQSTLNSGGHHYGIALDPLDEGTILSKQKSSVLTRYSAESPYESLDEIHIPGRLRFVHQIAAVKGGIYLANSHYNSLVFSGHNEGPYHEFYFNGLHSDVNHVNSVYPCGHQIFVLLHNRGKKPSQIVILDHDLDRGFEYRKTLNLWHGGCHNVIVDDGRLYYNASADGRFVVIDLERQEVIKEMAFPGHTKGMSLKGDTLVLGYSDSVAREQRVSARGYLVSVSTSDLSVRSIVDLNTVGSKGPVGNVNEVRCISGGERGHTRRGAAISEWEELRLAQARRLGWLGVVARHHGKRVRKRLSVRSAPRRKLEGSPTTR